MMNRFYILLLAVAFLSCKKDENIAFGLTEHENVPYSYGDRDNLEFDLDEDGAPEITFKRYSYICDGTEAVALEAKVGGSISKLAPYTKEDFYKINYEEGIEFSVDDPNVYWCNSVEHKIFMYYGFGHNRGTIKRDYERYVPFVMNIEGEKHAGYFLLKNTNIVKTYVQKKAGKSIVVGQD